MVASRVTINKLLINTSKILLSQK